MIRILHVVWDSSRHSKVVEVSGGDGGECSSSTTYSRRMNDGTMMS